MSKKRVFCSFDYDNDKNLKDLLIGQSKNSDSPFEVSDWSMKEAAPEPSWEEEAEKRIKRSDVVIIVLGSKTHSAPGVKKEVKMARDNSVSIFQIKPQNTNPTSVTNGGSVCNWTWENLKNLLG
ncbi:MAG: TIR domain-containing protein [Verrucomicrobia bacterium]|nr:TIR domain-containing protein [Verrucomicrobiota bacterium]